MPPRSIPTDPKKIIPPLLELDPYSAHQKTRTTAARLISHGHAEVAVDVLFEVSRELLKKGDAGSGVDLGTMMIRAYESKEQPVGDQERGLFLAHVTAGRRLNASSLILILILPAHSLVALQLGS